MISFQPIPQDQTSTIPTTYPLPITLPQPTNTPVCYPQDLQKLDQRLQEQPDSSSSHHNFMQPLPTLPPYNSIQHHRALLRAASLYAYHDLGPSSSLPIYFPPI